jgi:ribonuclease HI
VDGYPCAKYKKLRTLEDAEAWMQRAVPCLVKQNIKPVNHFPAESSTVKPAASSKSRFGSGSVSRINPDLSSMSSHPATGQSASATAEDVVYTDGACSGNGQPGSVAGIGVWWGVDDNRCVFPPMMMPST